MKSLTILFCLLLSVSVKAQTVPSIPFHDVQITIDGKQDEAIWQQLEDITGFYNYAPTDVGLADQQTSVKLFHDGDYLYVSAVYNDTESKSQVASLKRDVPIGLSDGIVMLLDTQNQQQNAYYFSVNAEGALIDGLVERINEGFGFTTSWNAVWNAKTTTIGNQKWYEIAIPLKALNYNNGDTTFGIQFYVRDIKKNAWTILNNVKRNYRLFDLRFTEQFLVENLPEKATSRFMVTPSVTVNYQNDVANTSEETTLKPSIDAQYNVTSSLKLDATLNPDFSQIDVDQQVTNLTRFSIFFPERRSFFLENSDLFSNLGVSGVNPFYSRRIGADSNIQFGLKLSGNVSPKTRIGVLNVQTDQENGVVSQNFGVFVAEHQVTKNLTTTGFLINRQETDKFEFIDDYNRVTGLNLNYKSNNNRWLGLANFGKSFNDGIKKDNNFYNAGIWFNKRGLRWNTGIRSLGKNYIIDIGFTPRLYNYDAINDVSVREGYTQATGGLEYKKFYDDSKNINSIRLINYNNDVYFDENGKLNQWSSFLNSAIFFKNLSAVYYVLNYDFVDLKYGFDILGNGNALQPDEYRYANVKVGFNSANNTKFRYRISAERGNFYNGKRTGGGLYLNYQLLPFANLEVNYDVNAIDLNELGKETFHLTRFTGQIFFNNRLNWTTYVQYNTQVDNFNINSRLQWEYKPLSYVYLVVTDNYNSNSSLQRTNWGIAFKMNYRLDF